MRPCPVCESYIGTDVFSMTYTPPDDWPLPNKIYWITCGACGMLYGDGDFNQSMLDEYYTRYYGYGINNPDNVERLKKDARTIVANNQDWNLRIVDFGGAGDDGKSIIVAELMREGFVNASCVGPADPLPAGCDIIYASHVIEHIYDLPDTMRRINAALKYEGTLIIDGPNAQGLLTQWQMPILDFNTKHLNHFTMRDYLNLGWHHGFEMVSARSYDLENAPAYQIHFKRGSMAQKSAEHVKLRAGAMAYRLREVDGPVNVWGLGDITWHLLSIVDLDVLDYIDNDPAMRGQTYKGKPILERPTNDAPIVIMSQGQRQRLIENIRGMGIESEIIEI